MADFKKQYPTQGDLAREQLRRRGLPFFVDVQEEVKARLARLPAPAWKAFALSCAERVMQEHERLPPAERSPSAALWRPRLDALWTALRQGQEETLRRSLAAWLREVDDLDDTDPAMPAVYAVECFAQGNAESAAWAASTAVDGAFEIAIAELQLDPNDFVWDPDAAPMPLAQEAMHSAVQGELAHQRETLTLLEARGVTPDVLDALAR